MHVALSTGQMHAQETASLALKLQCTTHRQCAQYWHAGDCWRPDLVMLPLPPSAAARVQPPAPSARRESVLRACSLSARAVRFRTSHATRGRSTARTARGSGSGQQRGRSGAAGSQLHRAELCYCRHHLQAAARQAWMPASIPPDACTAVWQCNSSVCIIGQQDLAPILNLVRTYR